MRQQYIGVGVGVSVGVHVGVVLVLGVQHFSFVSTIGIGAGTSAGFAEGVMYGDDNVGILRVLGVDDRDRTIQPG